MQQNLESALQTPYTFEIFPRRSPDTCHSNLLTVNILQIYLLILKLLYSIFVYKIDNGILQIRSDLILVILWHG